MHRTGVPHEIKPTHSLLFTRQPAWKSGKDIVANLNLLFRHLSADVRPHRPPLPSLHIHHVQGVFQQPELHLVIVSATGQVGGGGIHLQKPPAGGGDDARRSWLRSSALDLRLEVLVQENVVAVELKAVLVVYDHLLDTLEAVHKYVIDVLKHFSDPLPAVLRREVPADLLDGPLAYLCGSQGVTCSDTARPDAVFRRGS